MKKLLITSVLSLILPLPCFAEDLNQIFTKVNDLVAKQNYPKALEELGWAKKEIESQNNKKIATLLPASVEGFTGAEPKIEGALGFTTIERKYTNAGKTIELSLTGGGGGGLGGLAGLAKMGMMMGGAPGMDQFRIDGRTASLNTEGSNPELTIFLDSGSMLMLKAASGVDAATLKKFGESLKVAALDDYLRGTASGS